MTIEEKADPIETFAPTDRPPRDNIVRAYFSSPTDESSTALRAAEDGGMPTMAGHFAVFNDWTRISSATEGTFMERVAPGAFAKTFKENRDGIRVLLNHGKDPQVGDKPLGAITSLTEDGRGAAYEVRLLDTAYNRDIIPGLEAGLYGASFRFRVTKEDFNSKPSRSAGNPDGIPERTIREAHVMEFGPVTFPAYAGASAGVRSLTDDYLFDRLTADPARLRELVDHALPDGAEPAHSEDESRVDPDPPPDQPSPEQDPPEAGLLDSRSTQVEDKKTLSAAERPSRMKDIRSELHTIAVEHDGVLPPDTESRQNALEKELADLEADQAAYEARQKWLVIAAEDENKVEKAPVSRVPDFTTPKVRVQDPFDWSEIRKASRNPDDEGQLFRDSAMRAIEAAPFPQMDKATGQGRVADLIDTIDSTDRYIAKRVLLTGKPAYRRALRKYVTNRQMAITGEEQAALAAFDEFERTMNITTGSLGGFGITFDLDPTMVQTSTGAIVPYRRAARVVNVTTNEWRGVTSGGVVASYAAESAAATDNSPTLAQPAALVQKAHAFVPFTMEIQGDYPGLEAELGREIQDAKDVLEATQFTTGVGTTVFPQGIVTGATVAYTTATTLVLAAADLYGTEFTLAPRFRTNARWFANRAFYNRIRAIDTAGGAQLFTQNLTVGIDSNREGNTGLRLLGYPAEECSGFVTTISSGSKMAVFGDASYFVIVDRVGLNLELVPILFGGAQGNLPTGQRGLYAWWRNTSKVLSAAAFLTVTGL